jgi:hypothetical protein
VTASEWRALRSLAHGRAVRPLPLAKAPALLAAGYVRSIEDDFEPERSGYAITPEGRAALKERGLL